MWLWRVLIGCLSGGDLLVEAEVLFDCGDADFELEAFVDFVLLELGQLGVEAIDVVFGCHLSAKIRDVVFSRHLAFDIGDIVGDRGETALHLSFKISEAALDGREDAVLRATTIPVKMNVGVLGVMERAWLVGSPFTCRFDGDKLSTCRRR
jgi:hypothetical protein